MIRRILEAVSANLEDPDFNERLDEPAETDNVPNYSIHSASTKGGIKTLAGEPVSRSSSVAAHSIGPTSLSSCELREVVRCSRGDFLHENGHNGRQFNNSNSSSVSTESGRSRQNGNAVRSDNGAVTSKKPKKHRKKKNMNGASAHEQTTDCAAGTGVACNSETRCSTCPNGNSYANMTPQSVLENVKAKAKSRILSSSEFSQKLSAFQEALRQIEQVNGDNGAGSVNDDNEDDEGNNEDIEDEEDDENEINTPPELSIEELEEKARETLRLVELLASNHRAAMVSAEASEGKSSRHGAVASNRPNLAECEEDDTEMCVQTEARELSKVSHEMSVQADKELLAARRANMVDASMQTCPEGHYVCIYCSGDIPETERSTHRPACQADYEEKLAEKTAAAERRRNRRKKRRQNGATSEPLDCPDVSQTGVRGRAASPRAKLDKIHSNDLDTLLRTLKQMDTHCTTSGCGAKAQACRRCSRSYCPQHLREHGCTSALDGIPAVVTPSVAAASSSSSTASGGAQSRLTYFERSQLRRNLKKKMAVLEERRK